MIYWVYREVWVLFLMVGRSYLTLVETLQELSLLPSDSASCPPSTLLDVTHFSLEAVEGERERRAPLICLEYPTLLEPRERGYLKESGYSPNEVEPLSYKK